MYTLREAWIKMHGSEPFEHWDDKMYLFPIAQSEILKSGGVLTQNPGW